MLPSFCYQPAAGELRPGDLVLPWPASDESPAPGTVIGELARELGSKVPGRLISSAKSWLSHQGVDRSAPILPWGGDDQIAKISPLDASAAYLSHVRLAWNQRFAKYPLERQDIVLTLPASFDEGARALTLEAARAAGLERVMLLEEPQAACYDWIERQGERVKDALGGVRLLLVCDVGGGTTDLSLIEVDISDGEPRLRRVGVGDHLMLGGDNMDLALAHRVEKQFSSGKPLRAAELALIMQQCRQAKERLLTEGGPREVNVTLLGAGAGLVASARSAVLTAGDLGDVLEGFFPAAALADKPHGRRAAIVEFGLPYVADPAITRHLAAFLHRSQNAARGNGAQAADAAYLPDAVLLNGGVFHAGVLRQRVLDSLAQWRGKPPLLLENKNPHLAVARGAVAYGLARRGKGLRIGGGSARSFFLLLEGEDERQAVCILPRGAEEGRDFHLRERQFMLRLGQPVRFHISSASNSKPYRFGEIVAVDEESHNALPPIATVLENSAAENRQGEVPVELVSTLTEVGTLEISCVARRPDEQRWRLEFQLRDSAAGRALGTQNSHPKFDQACALIEQYYGERSKNINPKAVKTLRAGLEKLLGKRDSWDSAMLRELFAVMLDYARRRRRSADHERLWFNLIGYCLRPGFGYALDDWRCEQLLPLYEQGVQFGKEAQNWAEWWTLWRRIAGGLDAAAQTAIIADVAPYLSPDKKSGRKKSAKMQGYDDMVRLAGALEQIAAETKIALGAALLQRLQGKDESIQTWWAVGRLGARVPFYGSVHNVITPVIAAEWITKTLDQDWQKMQPAAFAAAMLARMSGDRERDIDASLRNTVAQKLRKSRCPDSWIAMVREAAALNDADQKRLFGESLPAGLRLL